MPRGGTPGIGFTITNSKEIHDLLASIPRAYQVKVQRSMIRDAFKPMMSEARRLTPVAPRKHRNRYGWVTPGTLRLGVKVKDSKRSRKVSAYLGIIQGPKKTTKDTYYGYWVHQGHKTRGKGLSARRMISGVPFLQQAYQAKRSEVMARYTKNARNVFDKVTGKWRLKGKI